MPPAGVDERASRVVRRSKRYRRAAEVLGSRARTLRHERGWTLEQAAERMQLDLKHLQKIEAGTVNVTLVTLVRVADGLRLPLWRLFTSRRA